MSTVAESELEQKISEFIIYVRDYAANKKGDFKLIGKRDNAILLCADGDVTLDFSVQFMFKILIHVANAMPAILDYRTREKAEIVYQNIHEILKGEKDISVITHHDDYGVWLAIPVDNVNYVLLVDCVKQNENPSVQAAKR